MILFTTHSTMSCYPLESLIKRDEEIKQIINDKCILAFLYCDEKELDKNGKQIGEKNVELQINKFESVASPLIFFLNNKEEVLGKIGMRQRKKEDFLEILNKAVNSNN